jgi:microcompartment protein CcmK/EutM
MRTGIIIGIAWASRKVKELTGCPMHVVQPVSSDGNPDGSALVAANPKGIGSPGDLVVYVSSTDATQAFEKGYAPVNASIVELVDKIS